MLGANMPETKAQRARREQLQLVRPIMERCNTIEQKLPAHPVHPNTGRKIPFHSQRFREIEELIGMCRKLSVGIAKE